MVLLSSPADSSLSQQHPQMQRVHPVTSSCLEVFIEKWKTSANDELPVCVFQDLTTLTLDVRLRCAFSSDPDCQQAINDEPYT